MAEATHLLCLPRKHKPSDIQPQGEGSGLDADKLDGLHAYQIQSQPGPHVSTHAKGGTDAFDGSMEILIRLENYPVDPANPLPGRVYFNTSTNRVKVYVPE
ncbi:MAG: hypothetical protein QXJ31_05215 [Candidatus Bathyarchaeia archaeon]